MPVGADLTPYVDFVAKIIGGLLVLLIGLVCFVWKLLHSQVRELGSKQETLRLEVVEVRTAFRFYLDSKSFHAAQILGTSNNPTPEWAQPLFDKYQQGTLTDNEKRRLCLWLSDTINDPNTAKGERALCIEVLVVIDTKDAYFQEPPASQEAQVCSRL